MQYKTSICVKRSQSPDDCGLRIADCGLRITDFGSVLQGSRTDFVASLSQKSSFEKTIPAIPSSHKQLRYQTVFMVSSHKFEDMEIWQEARVLVREVRAICKHPRVCKDFVFIDQITRAARSVMYNVAEGAEAQTNLEFIQFLGYAKRSAGEVRAQLYDALDQQYVDQSTFENLKIVRRELDV